jgi:hypothetical protein
MPSFAKPLVVLCLFTACGPGADVSDVQDPSEPTAVASSALFNCDYHVQTATVTGPHGSTMTVEWQCYFNRWFVNSVRVTAKQANSSYTYQALIRRYSGPNFQAPVVFNYQGSQQVIDGPSTFPPRSGAKSYTWDGFDASPLRSQIDCKLNPYVYVRDPVNGIDGTVFRFPQC